MGKTPRLRLRGKRYDALPVSAPLPRCAILKSQPLMRLRTALGVGFLGLAAWGFLLAQAPFKEYAALEYENFPVPTDWNQKTEWTRARLRYPDIYGYPFVDLRMRDGKPFPGYWTMDYPRSDRHLMAGIRRLTRIETRSVEQIVSLDGTGEVNNWPTLYAGKGPLELGHVDHETIDAIATRRVRVRLRMQAQIFGSIVLARPLRITDKESLLGCQAILILQRLTGSLCDPGHVRQDQAAQIRHVLTQREPAVDVDAVDDHVLGVLIDDALGSLLELLCIGNGPPVHQVTRRVVLPTFIVKSMGQLMTDGTAGIAVVWGVIHRRIVQRRLQYTGGKICFVHLWVEVGLYGRRRHTPFRTIERLADLSELASRLELRGTHDVAIEIVALYGDCAVVAPAVRIADLVDNGVEFHERLMLGRRTHPGQILQVRTHRLFNLRRHLKR